MRGETYTVGKKEVMNSGGVLCVFVPGIKGSVLGCDTCDRRSWPPQFLDSFVSTLRRLACTRSLKIERLMDSDDTECLTAHRQKVLGVLREVNALNGLIKHNVYGRFLDKLKTDCEEVGMTPDGRRRRVTLYGFAYDWTRGVSYAAEQLFSYLEGVVRGYDGVALIAHSMGGLVCRYMLEELVYHGRSSRPSAMQMYKKVKLLYAIGVPHYGAVRSLYQLVDPRDRVFAKHCREIQSLYDMIPFSNLESQVGGFSFTDGDGVKRWRSDIFLKRTDREVCISRDHWKPLRIPSGEKISDVTRANHISLLVDVLCSRFPELKGLEDRLCRGAAVHFSLDSTRKPSGCVYVCVNAVGVKSPSLIDKHNRLFSECEGGDGIVCSLTEGVAQRRGDATTDEVNRFSVHVSMLNYIDVFRAVIEILGTEIFSNTAPACWNGKKRLWLTFMCCGDRGEMCEITSQSSTMFCDHEVTATNLLSGYCVLEVSFGSCVVNGACENLCIDIAIVPNDRDNRNCSEGMTKGIRSKYNTGNVGPTHIKINADADWSRVTVILGGHYTISGVHNTDEALLTQRR